MENGENGLFVDDHGYGAEGVADVEEFANSAGIECGSEAFFPEDKFASIFPLAAAVAALAFDNRGTALRAGAEAAVGGVVLLGDDGFCVLADAVHEGGGVAASGFDLFEAGLPVAGEFGGGEAGIADEGEEVASSLGAHQIFFLPQNEFAGDEGFDDGGAGGGGAEAPLFHGFAEGIVLDEPSGGFHAFEEGGFSVAFGWLGGFGEDAGFVGSGLAGLHQGHLLIGILVVGFFLLLFLHVGVEGLPAPVGHHGAFGLKGFLADEGMHGGDVFDAGRVERGEQAADDGGVDFGLQALEIAGGLAGGQDRMVVGDFGVIDDSFGEGEFVEVEGPDKGLVFRGERAEEVGQFGGDVFADMAAVGPGVGEDFGLVEGLGGCEGLFGGEAEPSVHVLLKAGEVVELRCGDALFFGDDFPDGEGQGAQLFDECESLGFGFVFAVGTDEAGGAVVGDDAPVGFRFKGVDFDVAFGDEGEDGGLNAADAPEEVAGAVFGRVVAGGVEADDPVGFAAAAGGLIERVELASVAQFAEALLDGIAGEGLDPETAEGFVAGFGPGENIAEDEFALAAGIGGADDFIGLFEERDDYFELILRTLVAPGAELKGFGEHGEVFHPPGLPVRIVFVGFAQFHEVTEGPGDGPAVAFDPALFALICAQHGGEIAGDRRFFGKDNTHKILDMGMVNGVNDPFTFDCSPSGIAVRFYDALFRRTSDFSFFGSGRPVARIGAGIWRTFPEMGPASDDGGDIGGCFYGTHLVGPGRAGGV